MSITITGNLASDPELRFVPSGAAVATFTVVVSKRVKNGDKWEDGPASFYRCSIWRQAAENLVESLTKGDRVIVFGEMRQREYEDKQGQKQSVWEMEAEEVGPSLKFATAKTQRIKRESGFTAQAPKHDAWTTPSPDDEIPF